MHSSAIILALLAVFVICDESTTGAEIQPNDIVNGTMSDSHPWRRPVNRIPICSTPKQRACQPRRGDRIPAEPSAPDRIPVAIPVADPVDPPSLPDYESGQLVPPYNPIPALEAEIRAANHGHSGGRSGPHETVPIHEVPIGHW